MSPVRDNQEYEFHNQSIKKVRYEYTPIGRATVAFGDLVLTGWIPL